MDAQTYIHWSIDFVFRLHLQNVIFFTPSKFKAEQFYPKKCVIFENTKNTGETRSNTNRIAKAGFILLRTKRKALATGLDTGEDDYNKRNMLPWELSQ